MRPYDAIVLGVGGMGSAALYHLARRGLRVLGIERFNIPHDMGSSHGLTRIIRLAYYEHPSYVPLLKRSFELWRELERAAREQLLIVTGSVDAAPEGHAVFEGSRSSCVLHDLPHDVIDSQELTRRYPGYRLPPSAKAVFQPDGGFLLPERCIVAHVMGALEAGAVVHGQEQVLAWSPAGSGIELRTDRGAYRAAKLVVAAGAWSGKLFPDLAPLAVPERQVLGWFQPLRSERFQPATFPVFNLAVDEGRFYGFPVYGIPGFKIGRYHHLDEIVDPDRMDRMPNRDDERVLRECTERYFPDAAGPVVSMKACLFTNSPDEHFIIDRLRDGSNVVVAAGFSGHGFKFCSVVGEILADLAVDGRTRHDIDLFRLARFAQQATQTR
jgi:sarcosine oxidase